MGIGFTYQGCVETGAFCGSPEERGQTAPGPKARYGTLLARRSNVITLLDNNLTADPYCLDKLTEIRDRGLTRH